MAERNNSSRPQGRMARRLRTWAGKVWEQRRRAATCAAGALALAVGYHVVFGQNGLTAYQQKREDTHTLADQVKMLERENEALRGHVDRLQTDPGAIEHQAREELHYTRPGEVIVTLPADPRRTPLAKPALKHAEAQR